MSVTRADAAYPSSRISIFLKVGAIFRVSPRLMPARPACPRLGGGLAGVTLEPLGYDVGHQGVLQRGDLILEGKLALLQPLDLKLVKGGAFRQASDDVVKIAVFDPQILYPASQLVRTVVDHAHCLSVTGKTLAEVFGKRYGMLALPNTR